MSSYAERRLRRKTRVYLSLLSLVVGVALAISARGYEGRDYVAARIDGRTVHLIRIDMRDPSVVIRPAVVSGGQEFLDFIAKSKPRAVINGGYFDSAFKPLGDVVCDGKVLARGPQRSAVAVTKSGRIEFRTRQTRKQFDWGNYAAALAAGPMLVRSGKVAVNPEAEGFKPASRTIRASRSAIGVTADRKLLLAVVQEAVTLDEMARIMLKLRAVDAMNLDGGRSCCLYGDGEVKVPASSRLCSVLMIQTKK